MVFNRLFVDFVLSAEAAEHVNENICFLQVAMCYVSITPDMVQNIRIGVLKYVHGRVCLFMHSFHLVRTDQSACLLVPMPFPAASLISRSALALLAQSSCLVHWTVSSRPLPPGFGQSPCCPLPPG